MALDTMGFFSYQAVLANSSVVETSCKMKSPDTSTKVLRSAAVAAVGPLVENHTTRISFWGGGASA